MSKYKNKNKPVEKSESSESIQKVKMKFSEHKYYNDLNNPIFDAGKVYELEGAAWIQRWLKRGGEIVEGVLPTAKADELNPSTLVDQVIEVDDVPAEAIVEDTVPEAKIDMEE